jgi:hypothetical protein
MGGAKAAKVSLNPPQSVSILTKTVDRLTLGTDLAAKAAVFNPLFPPSGLPRPTVQCAII